MATSADSMWSKGDFVLDEGLEDEDEEMLAFEAARRTGNSQQPETGDGFESETAEQPAGEVCAPETRPLSRSSPHPDAVVLDGVPGKANRARMESFLEGCGEIKAFRICRMPNSTITARVQFSSREGATAALERNGMPFADCDDRISVSSAPADWDDFIQNHPSRPAGSVGAPRSPSSAKRIGSGSDAGNLRGAVMIGNVPVNLAEALPDAQEVKSSFWSVVMSAKKAAEALDQRARAAGADIDEKFHVADQLNEAAKRSQSALADVNENYKVREKLDAAAAAAKLHAEHAAEGAKSVDNAYGISRAIGEAAAKVSHVTTVAAREVDENLRISERARDMANSALQNESFSPVVKRAMSDAENAWQSVSGPASSVGTPVRVKKERPPDGIEQDACEPGVRSYAMADEQPVSTPPHTDP